MGAQPSGRDGPPRGGGDRLSRQRIVAAALNLLGSEGLGALSMRRLGRELGVEAMALYRHIAGREDLLEAVVEELVERLLPPERVDLGPHGEWQAYLQWLAHTTREIAYQHPQAFPLIATRHPAAPWLRPPLRSLAVVEHFLNNLSEHGFSDQQAVTAYRIFTSFLIGQLLLDVAQTGTDPMSGEDITSRGRPAANSHNATQSGISLAEYPTVKRLADVLAKDHAKEEFDAALEHILDRIEAMVTTGPE